MTKNKSLKSIIKKAMRGEGEDREPCQITAYDIVNKYDRQLTLDQSIVFLEKLEEDDRLIGKTEIPDINNDGVYYCYHYAYKRKKRGDRV